MAPRELKRSWITLVDRLGTGQFGEVWKALLKENNYPEYLVAAKTCLNQQEAHPLTAAASSRASMIAKEDLLQEASVMARAGQHVNLVSLIGVVTRGSPWTIVVSFCEHGDLGAKLEANASEGKPFSVEHKIGFCGDIAAGMGHLALQRIVHRDLAARNVLLATGMTCKVADFGLSRQLSHRDAENESEYVRPGNRAPFYLTWVVRPMFCMVLNI